MKFLRMFKRRERPTYDRLSFWESVFIHSPANGGQPIISVEQERIGRWQWPKDTWLQRRMKIVKKRF